MSKDPFGRFIELVEFDKCLIDAKNEVKKAKAAKEALDSKMASLNQSLSEAKHKKEFAQKEVDSKELELKELDVVIKEKREKLKNISNQKEYNAIKKELESVQKSLLQAEATIVALWNKLENAKKEFVNQEQIINAQIEELGKEIAESNNLITNKSDVVADLQNKRTTKEEGVPAEWKEKYAVMHGQVKNPVTQVVSECCSACFYHVTNQDMIDLKHRKLMQCKGCYRFIYLKEAFLDQLAG